MLLLMLDWFACTRAAFRCRSRATAPIWSVSSQRLQMALRRAGRNGTANWQDHCKPLAGISFVSVYFLFALSFFFIFLVECVIACVWRIRQARINRYWSFPFITSVKGIEVDYSLIFLSVLQGYINFLKNWMSFIFLHAAKINRISFNYTD